MQARTFDFGKIVVAAGSAGLLAGLGAWFLIPKQFVSETTLQLPWVRLTDEKAESDYAHRVAGKLLSRSSLQETIRLCKLYPAEVAKVPREDVVARMRTSIAIWPDLALDS
jgi:hypothetical protein